MRTPNFENLLRVLRREQPDRPTLFEFFLNPRLFRRLTGEEPPSPLERGAMTLYQAKGMAAAGYDYVIPTYAYSFGFPAGQSGKAASRSMNDCAVIFDRASFDTYDWQDPDQADYSGYDVDGKLPAGLKAIAHGPCGVLENAMALVGFEPLCYMLADDPGLAGEVFDAIGSRLLRFYEICSAKSAVGALIVNDDWGFVSSTMLSHANMRRYVFPWQKRIVEAIHAAGKPAILHSCGNLAAVMDDVIDDMRLDGKHSYEDKIIPVEEAYEKWGSRIAILGGLDVNFVCAESPEHVHERACAMLARTATRGGYALGTGNSVPEYVPDENYFAMISAATGENY